jgi:hypothetical protein
LNATVSPNDASTITVIAASSTDQGVAPMFSISALLQALAMLPQIETLIGSIVQSVEAAFGSTISGSAKLSAAEAKLNSYLSELNVATGVVTDIQAVATPLINAAVAMFNVTKTGAFAAGATPLSPAVAPTPAATPTTSSITPTPAAG